MKKVYCEEYQREYDLEVLESQNGAYEYEGKNIYLTQDAYFNDLVGHEDECVALAIDEEGNVYRVTWDITNSETENFDEVCDWDEYTVEKL